MSPIHDDLPWKKSTWRNMENKFYSDESKCDCRTSDSEIPLRKSGEKTRAKRPQVASTGARHKDKPIKVTHSRRKFSTNNPRILSTNISPRVRDNSTVNDQQRRYKRNYLNNKISTVPDLVETASTEVLQSWSRDHSPKYPSPSRQKKLQKKLQKNFKFIKPIPQSSSVSSELSVRGEKCCQCPEPAQHELRNHLVSKGTQPNPLKPETCPGCDCLKLQVHTQTNPYPQFNQIKKKIAEKIAQTSPIIDEQEIKNQKICRMLKTREARRIIGCCCTEDDRGDCLPQCHCPVSSYAMKTRTTRVPIQGEHQKPQLVQTIPCIMTEPCPSEVDSSISCGCDISQLKNLHNERINDHDSSLLTEEKRKRELQKMIKQHQTLSARLRQLRIEVEDNNKKPIIDLSQQKRRKDIKIDVSTSFSIKETTDRACQCDVQSSSTDPVKAVASLCENWKAIIREMDPENRPITSQIKCQAEYCQCKPRVDGEHKDGIEAESTVFENNAATRVKRRSKRKVKRHQFALPRVVKPEDSSGKFNIPKMFVYPPDEQQGTPLAVYKTSSFVNCSIKEKNNHGFKYYITYVQKYVSPIWRPDENADDDEVVKHEEYISSDDYG